MRRYAIALLVAAPVAFAADAPHARSPCMPDHAVTLTGMLTEVRQDDATISTEAAILSGLPRRVCVEVTNPLGDGTAIRVTDCDFPHFEITAKVGP